MTAPPLEAVRVLDFTHVVAGPYCTRMLADIGAQVTKVDVPSPDGMSGPRRSSGSPVNNLGKRSIVLDLKHPRGVEVARALAARSDVLIENFAPGVMDRLGLGYEALRDEHPRLIYASIRGFAGDGPHGDRRAFGATAHAEAGWLWVQQQAQGGDRPFAPGVTVADIITAVGAFSTIMTALYRREQTGAGQRVEAALMDWQLAMLSEVFGDSLNRGAAEWEPFRHPIHATRDGRHVTINIGSRRNWQRIATALGHEGEPMPGTVADGNALVAEWVGRLSAEDVTIRLAAEGAAYGLLSTVDEAATHPYVVEQALVSEVPDPLAGALRVLASPMLLSGARQRPRAPAPLAGEHTRSTLLDLGYSDQEVTELLDAGAVQESEGGGQSQ